MTNEEMIKFLNSLEDLWTHSGEIILKDKKYKYAIASGKNDNRKYAMAFIPVNDGITIYLRDIT